MTRLSRGDKVQWETSQGKTTGTVQREVHGTAHAGGHEAKASAQEPQYEVKSDKTGKKAIHHPQALHRRG